MGQDSIALVNVLGTVQRKNVPSENSDIKLIKIENITDADDPQASYLLHCWGRMCRVLGQDFLPYLPAVIPPLTELAGAKADIQLLDDEEQVAQVEQEEGWELVPLKARSLALRLARSTTSIWLSNSSSSMLKFSRALLSHTLMISWTRSLYQGWPSSSTTPYG